MYIIIVSIVSVTLLIVTAWIQYKNDKNSKNKTTKRTNEKQHRKQTVLEFLKSSQLINAFQELIIVFFSAVLAIYLTEFANNYNTQKDIASLMEVSCNAQMNLVAQASEAIKDIVDNNPEKEYSLEDKIESADAIIKSYNGFIENILLNERVMSQLDPMSYTLLNICRENIAIDIAYLQDELKQEKPNQQKIAEHMISYCSSSCRMAVYFEFLSHNIQYNLLEVIFIDRAIIEHSAYYKIYTDCLNNIEEIFDLDKSEFEGFGQWFLY